MVGKWHLGYRDRTAPLDRGFQSFYGFLSGANSYTPGAARLDNILRGKKPVKETEYLTDALARESVEFIKRDDERPFFLYLAYNAVHAPMEAPAKYTSPFTSLTRNRKTFAGMRTAMDASVGRVLTALREKAFEDRTVEFFLSDNGGPTQQTTSKNGLLPGIKGHVYEGEIRVQFLVQCKGQVKPGTIVRDPCFSLDILPTILDIAGIPKEEAKQGLEGASLVPLLQGSSSSATPRAIFWRMGPQNAVRYGDWKLVVRRGTAPELYNLMDDIAESKNLAESKPEKLAELQ